MTEAKAAKVTVIPSAKGKPVRRAHRARFIALVEMAMALEPGVDAVLIVTDKAGDVVPLVTAGTPMATVWGMVSYARQSVWDQGGDQ